MKGAGVRIQQFKSRDLLQRFENSCILSSHPGCALQPQQSPVPWGLSVESHHKNHLHKSSSLRPTWSSFSAQAKYYQKIPVSFAPICINVFVHGKTYDRPTENLLLGLTYLFMCQGCRVTFFILELIGTHSSCCWKACCPPTCRTPLSTNIIFTVVFCVIHKEGIFTFCYISEWVKHLLPEVGSLDVWLSSSTSALNSALYLLWECPNHWAIVSPPGSHSSCQLLEISPGY